jgi:SEC-C motif-containing protein
MNPGRTGTGRTSDEPANRIDADFGVRASAGLPPLDRSPTVRPFPMSESITASPSPASDLCPCGSGKSHADCCGPILAGAPAPTAESLMRSRYAAYITRNYLHLRRSLSKEQQADFSEADAREWAESSEWLGLEITATQAGGPDDQEGTVDFVARFRVAGEERKHVEKARFIREEGKWVYAGQIVPKAEPVRREAPKVGRNDPCPCGSGKKYKKCHGAAG